MNPPCSVCDRQTATHRAFNPGESDTCRRTWLVCGPCIHQAAAQGPQYEYELLPEEVD